LGGRSQVQLTGSDRPHHGTRLYTALFEALRGQDLHRALAGVTLPNPASVALHRRLGFERAALYREVGRKFDRYWDVAWFQKDLA
jgi:phosphinothricin acetyltransferase